MPVVRLRLTHAPHPASGRCAICCSCGCVINGSSGQPDDNHGDPRQITLSDIMAAAEANGIAPMDVVGMIGASLAAVIAPDDDVAKSAPEQQFVLGVAYQAGPDPKIAKGLDGARDYFTEAELEKAAWSFMLNGQQHGMFHLDGTTGAARPVENFIYRNPVPWIVAPDLVVRKGDWCQGLLLDDKAWALHKAGKVNGLSPQGIARRRKRTRAGELTSVPADRVRQSGSRIVPWVLPHRGGRRRDRRGRQGHRIPALSAPWRPAGRPDQRSLPELAGTRRHQ